MDALVIPTWKVPGWDGLFDADGQFDAELFPGVDLAAALKETYTTDAMFQPFALRGEPEWTRLNKGGVRVLLAADEEVELTWAVLDYDTLPGPGHMIGHWPWDDADQAYAVADALTAGLTERTGAVPTVYVTRAGLRVMWRLGTPIPMTAAASFLRQFHALVASVEAGPVGLDSTSDQWWRVYRLPHVQRSGGKDFPPRLTMGQDLEWCPDEVEIEEIRASGKAEASADCPEPRKLTRAEWKHIPKTWRDDLKRGEPMFQEGGDPGRNNGILCVVLPRVCSSIAKVEIPDKELIYRAFHAVVEAQGEPSLDRLWQMINDYVYNDIGEFALERTINHRVMGAAFELPLEKVDELRGRLVPSQGKAKAMMLAKQDASMGKPPKMVYTGDSRMAFVYYEKDKVFRPKAKDALAVVLEKLHGIQLRTPRDTPMGFPEVFDSVGTDAHRQVVKYWQPGAVEWFEHETKTLHRITSPPDGDPQPVYHEGVARWLESLPADPRMHPRLLDWLSQVTNLDRPIAALVMQGSAGVGKGLLALGIGQLWGGSPGGYKDNVGTTYNPDLVRTPVLFGNEGLHTTAENAVEAFKALITDPDHLLSGKWMLHSRVEGYVRVIIAANKIEDIQIPSDITPESMAALEERILFMPVRNKARDVLADHDTYESGEAWVKKADGSPGAIAEHVLWLAENHTLSQPADRLLVYGETNGNWRHSRVVKSAGLDGSILMALASWADKAAPIEGIHALIDDGTYLVVVSSTHLHANWVDLTRDRMPPRLRAVSGALGLLSVWDKSRGLRIGRNKRRYHAIDVQMILDTAEECGIGDEDTLNAFIKRQANLAGGSTNNRPVEA